MKEFKWQATAKVLARMNFIPCKKCENPYIHLHSQLIDGSEPCVLCPKANSKYAREYNDERNQVWMENLEKNKNAPSWMDEFVDSIRSDKYPWEKGDV